MIDKTALRKYADVAVAGIRIPILLLDQRLPEGSSVRRGVDALLHALDSVTQHAPSGGSAPAEPPSPEEAHRRAAAEATKQETRPDRETVAETIRERQPDTGELADPELDVAEVQAQLQAKHAVEERAEESQLRNGR